MVNKLIESGDSQFYKINIAGFSTDHFKTFNPEGYTILCRLGETCDGLHYFPKTSKIILETHDQCRLLFNHLETEFITNIAKDLGISPESAVETSMSFFSDKSVVVQPTGFQGNFYKFMRYTQNSVPMIYTSEAVSILKTTGLTGLQIITKAPLTFVGATYIGAVFFSYCGSVAGNNAVGAICNATSFGLSRPMRGIELTLNGLILTPISNAIGLPLMLNGTQELLKGKGIALQDYKAIGIAFEKIGNSTVMQKIKAIYKIVKP